ncbi:hydantoinase B/oxoprolinase family protein [Streptomyces sp. NPDC090088]|uniref:hydantoinase B/oxoprolinase family protein n=1 Tax=Streptomyces sp. NPDC090088 TaxID=3365944 RepID=UPI00382AB82D
MTTTPPVQVDPVTLEILRANLVAITDEMKTNLRRTAYNAIIYEAQDFTVGLFDRNGDTVSIGLGLPMFVGGLSQAIKAKIEHYGYDGIEPGDILLTNDAYIMGSHLNHMIFTVPIFADGEIVAFASSMAHWLDVGGVLGGTTQDIYSEGLQVPIVKIFKRGVQDDELTRIIRTNVRFADLALGDLRAQIAAIRTGERRLTELIERYGADVVTHGFELIYERGEALARHAVEAIPDGEYVAETTMDDDGVTLGKPVPIKVRVVIEGDLMTIDLSGVSPQVAGYFNSGATAGRSAAQVAFKFLTSPHEYPVNEGSLRPVRIVLPPGLVVSATKPAAMRWWMTYPMTIIDCVFRALAQAVPGGTIAGHHADLAVLNLYGTDPASGRLFLYNGGAQGGGWGATAAKDGENATICINDGDTHNTPVEVSEAKYPSLLVERYALRPDSGGPGRHRGGLGTVYEIRTDTPVRLNTFMERTRSAPWGIDGGGDALPNRISLLTADGEPIAFRNGKVDSRPVGAGDRIVVETGGGGGYGPPHERPVDDVVRDVRAGYVTAEAAREHYGVALAGPLDGDLIVDEATTTRLRTR